MPGKKYYAKYWDKPKDSASTAFGQNILWQNGGD
ncbi:hypothetical protein BSS2_I1283 [Brucella suis bv. 1 str. S2]|uniref:Uncharacterized protein n=1 Tax=Brucella suis biovar 1 (strain 1330) TaxID=204722 RepID=A0A0H3G817_BRUSU|nr:hypothetical protein BR1317 [Brucella suis 1330]AEM18652.1 hypothetical protein BS1330_I1313 [Brucella suis 1330]AEU06320.1 hypothetical protein BSVBI22_A1313 [Brucella suis VBI22]AHN46938.1 hypothetical protein BSS2_I1283 [Brucella suis bv. 1 str. S2]CDL76707.1 unnamed protein product [Brucella canis str. Oliveri]